MRILTLLIASSFSLGCAMTQELGSDHGERKREDAGAVEGSGLVVDAAPSQTAPTPTATASWGTCPSEAPVDRAECNLDVGWCNYPFAPERGLVSKCSCGADRRWTCLRVREVLFHKAITGELPFTNATCTEGARCAEGVRCAIPKQRTCSCTSSRRFVCGRPAE